MQFVIPVTATVESYDKAWLWTVTPGEDGEPVKFLSKGADLVQAASDDMNAALLALVPHVRRWGAISLPARQGHLDHLKNLGRALTEALFDGRQDEFASQLSRLAVPVITQLTTGSEEQPLFEYCLLKEGDAEFFLGERCLCIYGMIRRERRDIRKHYAAAGRTGPRIVGYAEDNSLDSACLVHGEHDPARAQEEIVVAIDLAGNDGKLSVLSPLSEAVPDEEIAALQRWICEKYHVVHFNCCSPQQSEDPKIQLRAGALIGVSDMNDLAVPADFHGCFVFLNASSSAIGRKSLRTSLAEFFRQKRAACVVCTTGPIEDGFATRLAKTFYGYLHRDGMSVMNALLSARQALLEEGHPMALQYTYIGSDSYRLV